MRFALRFARNAADASFRESVMVSTGLVVVVFGTGAIIAAAPAGNGKGSGSPAGHCPFAIGVK